MPWFSLWPYLVDEQRSRYTQFLNRASFLANKVYINHTEGGLKWVPVDHPRENWPRSSSESFHDLNPFYYSEDGIHFVQESTVSYKTRNLGIYIHTYKYGSVTATTEHHATGVFPKRVPYIVDCGNGLVVSLDSAEVELAWGGHDLSQRIIWHVCEPSLNKLQYIIGEGNRFEGLNAPMDLLILAQQEIYTKEGNNSSTKMEVREETIMNGNILVCRGKSFLVEFNTESRTVKQAKIVFNGRLFEIDIYPRLIFIVIDEEINCENLMKNERMQSVMQPKFRTI